MRAKPIISAEEAAGRVKEHSSLMVGGFMACGSPHTLIRALVVLGTGDLTLICNDAATHNLASGSITGVARLIQAHQVKKLIASHIGANQEAQRQLKAGETEVVLVPQGTLVEQVRAGGAGIGGILTPTGVGTEAAKGKRVISLADHAYLLELPLKADVALIKAQKADRAGNLVYHGTARNFNPLFATAATLVIAEAEEIVEIGALDPDLIHTPSTFVDYLVLAQLLEG